MSIVNAFQFASNWYHPDEIYRSIQRSVNTPRADRYQNIPHDVHSREFAEWLTNEYRLAMAKGIEIGQRDASEEIDRLKAGRFTEDEFQNLCHTFSADDACRFRQGCEEYQRKLFGSSADSGGG